MYRPHIESAKVVRRAASLKEDSTDQETREYGEEIDSTPAYGQGTKEMVPPEPSCACWRFAR